MGRCGFDETSGCPDLNPTQVEVSQRDNIRPSAFKQSDDSIDRNDAHDEITRSEGLAQESDYEPYSSLDLSNSSISLCLIISSSQGKSYQETRSADNPPCPESPLRRPHLVLVTHPVHPLGHLIDGTVLLHQPSLLPQPLHPLLRYRLPYLSLLTAARHCIGVLLRIGVFRAGFGVGLHPLVLGSEETTIVSPDPGRKADTLFYLINAR